MKKLINLFSFLPLLGLLTLTTVPAYAQTVTPTTNQAARLANLHTLADNAIAKRLTDLQNVQTRINGLVKLTSDQKNTFSSDIATDINGLTSLKAKCDADTDVVTLQSDYKSIFTQYRIYAEFLPVMHLEIASDTMDVTADKLSDLAGKLQTRIQNAGNPTNLISLLSDMQAKIADAKTQYSSVQSQVASLTPQGYDSNPSGVSATIKNARAEIQTGASDLKAAFADAKQIIAATH